MGGQTSVPIKIGEVAALFRYAAKSMGGEPLEAAALVIVRVRMLDEHRLAPAAGVRHAPKVVHFDERIAPP